MSTLQRRGRRVLVFRCENSRMAVTKIRVLETGRTRESMNVFEQRRKTNSIMILTHSNPFGGITEDKKARPNDFDLTTTGANGRNRTVIDDLIASKGITTGFVS